MKKKILKEEALDFFTKNPTMKFAGYDDAIYFIKRLYEFGAKKVYVVEEYPHDEEDLSKCGYISTLYVVIGKTISIDLAVHIAGSVRADEVSYVKAHKAIRLWWG